MLNKPDCGGDTNLFRAAWRMGSVLKKRKKMPNRHVELPAEAVNKAAAESNFYEVKDCYINFLIYLLPIKQSQHISYSSLIILSF